VCGSTTENCRKPTIGACSKEKSHSILRDKGLSDLLCGLPDSNTIQYDLFKNNRWRSRRKRGKQGVKVLSYLIILDSKTSGNKETIIRCNGHFVGWKRCNNIINRKIQRSKVMNKKIAFTAAAK
jgi:hypothetical protein